MKIQQDKPKFNPIVITLETREEARAFIEIVDHVGSKMLTANANDLAVRISNMFTNCEVSTD